MIDYHHHQFASNTWCNNHVDHCYCSVSISVEGNAKPDEIDMLYELSKQIEGHTICALGDGAAWPVQVGVIWSQ